MVYASRGEKRLNLWNRDVMNTIGIKQTSTQENDEIDLMALFNHLMANKWLIMAVTLITFSLGVVYTHMKIPLYQADVLLQVDNSNRANLGQTGFAAQLAYGAVNNSVATQIALIKSRFILEPVVEALGLDIDVILKKESLWRRIFNFNNIKPQIIVQLFDVPQKKLNKKFKLKIDQKNNIILLDDNNKMILQGQAGTLLTDPTKTIRLQIKPNHNANETLFILTKRPKFIVASSLSNQMTLEESGGKAYQGTGIISMSLIGSNPKRVIRILNKVAQVAMDQDAKKKAQEASQTLEFLYKQLPITQGQLEKAEYALNNYRAKSGKIDIKLQTQFLLNQLSELDKKISELRIHKIDMLQQYTAEHPAFIALETQFKALNSQRHKLELILKKLPASDQIAVNLLRDVNVKKTLYVILLNKIQELQVVKAGTVSGLRILAHANIPDAPLPLKRSAIYFGSILLGLLLSALIIFGRRIMSPRVEDPHWSERQFNLPNLAIIPYCKEQSLIATLLDGSKEIPLLAYTNPRNLSIESLRSLRTSLQVSLASAKNNIVSILGVAPGVGKSFVSANLSYLLASAGKRVLMIDADLRRGTMHKYLHIPASPGLADVLNGTAELDVALVSSIHENLFCLPRGVYPDDPSELLASIKFKTLMQELSLKFDVIVIDTAPVLLVTDAVLVGGLAGTNYIVFGAGAHQPTEIEIALKRLMGAGVQMHGSIFNFHRAQSKKASYGQYYNYNYYYDESMKNPT
jgi:tyrosine-protein kinase Etk/Wzc